MFELDQYYTPLSVAQDLVERCVSEAPSICVDSTCGKGNLLIALSKVFRDVSCVGIDKDPRSIRYLRRKYPDWRLSVADLLDERAHWRSKVISSVSESDLLLLNPPFSMKKKKKVSSEYKGLELKCSLAMAHILKSIELFKPSQGAVVVVPESLLSSDVDKFARLLLAEDYAFSEIFRLKSSTFRGVRANASVVKFIPSKNRVSGSPVLTLRPDSEKTQLIRGGLPVHQKTTSESGVPYLHSTDILPLKRWGMEILTENVEPISRGVVSGWVILLPRVGCPSKESLELCFLSRRVQLSDCVIALKSDDLDNLKKLRDRIKRNWNEFNELYRGTGARYVTVSRLTEWLNRY